MLLSSRPIYLVNLSNYLYIYFHDDQCHCSDKGCGFHCCNFFIIVVRMFFAFQLQRELCFFRGASATGVWLVADFCRPIFNQ